MERDGKREQLDASPEKEEVCLAQSGKCLGISGKSSLAGAEARVGTAQQNSCEDVRLMPVYVNGQGRGQSRAGVPG